MTKMLTAWLRISIFAVLNIRFCSSKSIGSKILCIVLTRLYFAYVIREMLHNVECTV